jgi:hypothetical protein
MTLLRAAPTVTEAEENLELSLDAFIRSVGVKRGVPHALFLGAGASTGKVHIQSRTRRRNMAFTLRNAFP